MVASAGGLVVLVPFPSSDPSDGKVPPALVLADWLLC
jgi:hypothetical protein